MAATQRLAGVRIHLSGSNKELQADIAVFVQKFAAKVFSEGGSIVHGSHPSFTEPLRKAAEHFIQAGGIKGALTLVRAKSYSTDQYSAEIEEHRAFASVEIVPVDNQPETA